MTREERLKQFTANRLAMMDRIRRDKRLTSSSRLVGAELCNRLDFETGDAYPSQDYLVEKLGLVERTVKTAVKALAELGYFKIVKRGWANRYEPNFEAANQVQNLPLTNSNQVQNLPQMDEIRGKKGPHQVQKTSEIRGKKVPPTSLENSLITSGRPEGGAPVTGAACPAFSAIAGDALRLSLGEAVHRSWLAQLRLVGDDEGVLTLSAPNKLIAERVKRDYARQIIFAAGRPLTDRLEIVVSEMSGAVAKHGENADARWLLDVGIDLVAEQRGISRRNADADAKDYLSRSGNDPARLREVLTAAAEQGLQGDAFDRRVKDLAREESQRELRLLRVVEDRRRA